MTNSKASAYNPGPATNNNTTPPPYDWVIAPTLEQAKTEAKKRGIPDTRAVTYDDAKRLVRSGQHVLVLRDKLGDDRWAETLGIAGSGATCDVLRADQHQRATTNEATITKRGDIQ